ncbi:MAG: tetratricopeptide repeat protein [Saprospiraceae bacterium]|nr:tetratricopeptide repeat protein [Saprospiraceae bacterium]
MKKITLLLIFSFAIGFSFAQKAKVVSAFNYLANKQLDKAKLNIDEACEHEQTKGEAKTWFYRGNIYFEIHRVNHMTSSLTKGMSKEDVRKRLTDPLTMRNAKVDGVKKEKWSYEYDMDIIFDLNDKVESWNEPRNGAYKELDKNALNEAYEAYKTCLKLDNEQKNEYKQQVKFRLYICGEQFYNQGVVDYNSKNYKDAIDNFQKQISIKTIFGEKDTVTMFYVAVAAELGKEHDLAKETYTKLMQMKYEKASIYSSLSSLYKEEGDTVNALSVLQRGRRLFPDNFDLLILETNIYLNLGENDKAQRNLETAVEKEPNNPNLHYVIGTQYFEKLKQIKFEDDSATFNKIFKTSEKYLQNAINLKPDYFDALFNIGALYVNEGVRIFENAQGIDPSNFKAYDAEKAKFEAMWNKAVIYMEKALVIKPDDFDTLVTLKQLYARLKMLDKLKSVNEKLDNNKEK